MKAKKVVILAENMCDAEEREIFQAGIPYDATLGKIENEDNIKIPLNNIWVDFEVKWN